MRDSSVTNPRTSLLAQPLSARDPFYVDSQFLAQSDSELQPSKVRRPASAPLGHDRRSERRAPPKMGDHSDPSTISFPQSISDFSVTDRESSRSVRQNDWDKSNRDLEEWSLGISRTYDSTNLKLLLGTITLEPTESARPARPLSCVGRSSSASRRPLSASKMPAAGVVQGWKDGDSWTRVVNRNTPWSDNPRGRFAAGTRTACFDHLGVVATGFGDDRTSTVGDLLTSLI